MRRGGRPGDVCFLNVFRVHFGSVRRRSTPIGFLHHPADRSAVGDRIRQRREAAAHLRGRVRMAERPRAQRHTVAIPIPGEELALVARHVDADRAFGLAGAALEAQIEHLVHAAVGQLGVAQHAVHRQPQGVGAAAGGVRLLARHHVRRAHRAFAALAAKADAAAHLHRPAETLVLGKIEHRLGRRCLVAGAEAQVRGDWRRVDDAARVEEPVGIEGAFHRAERFVQLGAEHLFVECAAHQAVAVLA